MLQPLGMNELYFFLKDAGKPRGMQRGLSLILYTGGVPENRKGLARRGFKQGVPGTLVIWSTVRSSRIRVEREEDREEKERRGEEMRNGGEEEEEDNDKVEEEER